MTLWLCCGNLQAQTIDSTALMNFSDAVLELQNSELLRHGTLAIQVKGVKSKKNIFQLNHERSLPSASILKLVTTGSVLSALGADYRFETLLQLQGQVRADTLYGNVIVRGGGDPSLGSSRFPGYPDDQEMLNRWLAKIQKEGVGYIKGEIIVDASYYEGLPHAESWIWGDIGNSYGAGIWGLNFNENQFKANFIPGKKTGDPVGFSGTSPALAGIEFENKLSTGERGSGDQSIFYSSPLGPRVQFTGTVPAGYNSFSVKGALPNPPLYVAEALRARLKASGIGIEGALSSEQSALKVIDIYKSAPLHLLCKETNLWSINLYADSFLRLFGKRLSGKSDFDTSILQLRQYWQSRGADMRGFMIKDGSGLSPSGSLTVQNMTDFLSVMNQEKVFKEFYQGMAVMGQSGTVRRLGKKSNAEGNIRAKSGSIEGTRAYAGYVTTRSGDLLTFAMIAHKYQPDTEKIVSEELSRLMVLLANL